MPGHAGEVTDLAVSQDGRVAVSVSLDANVIVWSLRTGKEVARFRDAPASAPYLLPMTRTGTS